MPCRCGHRGRDRAAGVCPLRRCTSTAPTWRTSARSMPPTSASSRSARRPRAPASRRALPASHAITSDFSSVNPSMKLLRATVQVRKSPNCYQAKTQYNGKARGVTQAPLPSAPHTLDCIAHHKPGLHSLPHCCICACAGHLHRLVHYRRVGGACFRLLLPPLAECASLPARPCSPHRLIACCRPHPM